MSTIEAEYITAIETVKEALWLKGLVNEFEKLTGNIDIYCNSQSSFHLAKNQVFHTRTKYIDVRYHFIRQFIKKDMVMLEKIRMEENEIDMLSHCLKIFRHLPNLINLRD